MIPIEVQVRVYDNKYLVVEPDLQIELRLSLGNKILLVPDTK